MEEKPLETREKILNAATDLFASRGFHETSMSAIARKAGLGKGTLYWYFKSKHDLFNEMFTQKGEAIIEEIHSLQAEELLPEEKIYKFIRFSLRKTLKNKKITQLFIDNENNFNQEFKDNLFKVYLDIIREVEKIIEDGSKAGTFRPISSRYVAASLIGITHGMKTMLLLDEEEDINEMIDFIFELTMKGISKKEEI